MINLHKLGAAYAKGWDESRSSAWDRDPWLMQLKARRGRGHVYVHGKSLLAAATTRKLGQRITQEVAGARIVANGDDGMNVTFPPSALDQVAGILKLRRRRVVTPAMRELGKRLAARQKGNQ